MKVLYERIWLDAGAAEQAEAAPNRSSLGRKCEGENARLGLKDLHQHTSFPVLRSITRPSR
ncbi:MAG: hypothetical protein WBX25_01995, partial [Rhodomicrobium sp.]